MHYTKVGRFGAIFASMEPDIDLFNEEGAETLYERKTFVIDKGQEPFRID